MRDVDETIKEALRRAGGTFEPAEPLSLPRVHNRARVLRARTMIWVLVLALFIASGALIATRVPSSSKNGSLIGPSKKVNKDPNYAITLAVTKQLADGAAIPPGSVRSATPPIQNHSLGPEMPAGNNHFVDMTHWWTVPMSVRETFRWLARHGPPNIRYSVGGSGGDGSRFVGFHISDDASQAYTDRAIEYSMAAIDGGHTVVRVDGTALWLTSTPVPDTRGTPAIRVTAAHGCPASLAGYHDISNATSEELKKQLLFSEQPTGALKCRYRDAPYGHSKRAPKLVSQTTLDLSAAGRVARAIHRLKVGFDGGGIGSCLVPIPGTQLTEIIVFSYAGRPDVDLWYGIYCRGFIVNGFVAADEPVVP